MPDDIIGEIVGAAVEATCAVVTTAAEAACTVAGAVAEATVSAAGTVADATVSAAGTVAETATEIAGYIFDGATPVIEAAAVDKASEPRGKRTPPEKAKRKDQDREEGEPADLEDPGQQKKAN